MGIKKIKQKKGRKEGNETTQSAIQDESKLRFF
jgi:hypothetical protein